MESNAEIKKYEETVNHLYKLLQRACQERDEARDQLQLLIRNFQPSTQAKTYSTIPQLDHPKQQLSCDLSLSSLQSNNEKKISSMNSSNTRIVESCNMALKKQKIHQNKFGIVNANIDDVASSSLSLHSIKKENYLSSNIYDKESVVPTSLSLAFPSNSKGPSHMRHGSGSGSGLLVKNEPMSYMESNGMHNHTIAGKKRKFL
jgi:hypothetical protein